MEGDDDFQRRNIHDDLEQLLEDNSSDDVPFVKATKMEAAQQDDQDLDSPGKKRVLFTDSAKKQNASGMMNLDMTKLRKQQESLENDQDDNDGDEGQGEPGESTTAKKKRKRNRKKNKNKQGADANDANGKNGDGQGAG